MHKHFILLVLLFLHFNPEMNAQSGWYHQTSGTENILYGIHFSDANTGTAGGIYGTVLRTTDGGKIWTEQNSGTNAHLFDVTFLNSDTGIAVGIAEQF